MLAELLTLNVFQFLLVFARIGAAFAMLPGYSAPYVSMQGRLVIALGVSLVVLAPLAGRLPETPGTPVELILLLAGEATVGVFIGSLARIFLSAVQVMGSMLSMVSSLANAFVQSPISEEQSGLLTAFFATVAVTLIFVTDAHGVMLRAVVDSYTLFAPGAAPEFADLSAAVGRAVADSFSLGIQLTTPFIITVFAYYVGLGLVTKLMPALPIFFIGMPLQIAGQIYLLMLVLPVVMMLFLGRFDAWMRPYLAP
jgi:flagellar biosynthetic protein FliR